MRSSIIASVILIYFLPWLSLAKPITKNEAKQCAYNWMSLHGVTDIESANIFRPETDPNNENYDSEWVPYEDFYIVNIEPDGFVIVSWDDVAYPILYYSYDGNYIGNELPPQFKKMLHFSAQEISSAVINDDKPNEQTEQEWNMLKSKNLYKSDSNYEANDVSPLIKTTWSQGEYYNADCPSDSGGPDGHAVVGCVAVAMAQIMNYHQHPAQGTGAHSYDHSDYGTLSANFGATNYDWNSMPDSLSNYDNDVAELLYHCGVSVEMDYGPDASGAYSSDARDALVNYYGYNSSASLKWRMNYPGSEWTTLLKNEIDAGQPLYYNGSGSAGGHAFNLDGYEGTDHFHVNWGWGGSYDGYYYLNDLTPSNYNFNEYQGTIAGLKPAIPNEAPTTPSAPSGPSSGEVDNTYSFSTSSSDPDGDSITYRFDWGDGNTSSWGSSSQSHSWSSEDTYQIKVQAKDDHGATSSWSSSSSISISEINTHTYKLPDSGQHNCYDDDGNVIDGPKPGEPFYGQDAQHQGPEPFYRNNSDGTVTDLNTGLMWMQASADTDNDGEIDSRDEQEWQPSIDYCDSLEFAGYTDWRLPDRKELMSIVDYGETYPAINPVFDCRSSFYWSSSTYAFNQDYAWRVYFDNGKVYYRHKGYTSYVRCVRDEP